MISDHQEMSRHMKSSHPDLMKRNHRKKRIEDSTSTLLGNGNSTFGDEDEGELELSEAETIGTPVSSDWVPPGHSSKGKPGKRPSEGPFAESSSPTAKMFFGEERLELPKSGKLKTPFVCGGFGDAKA